jgi:glycine hydroxymethyltransferase
MSLLEPGDTVLAMDLNAGGHLTHGSPASFSGRIYRFVGYGVDPHSGLLDYEAIASEARRCRPKLIIAGASSYPRVIDFARFAEIAREVGAYLLVDMAHIAGLIAARCHPSPLPYADFVTSTTHKTLRGPRGGIILAKNNWKKLLDTSVCPRIQGGPLMHVIAGKALCFADAMTPAFVQYQRSLQQAATVLSEALIAKGFTLVTGGTDNHLLMIDLRPQHLTGKVAEQALEHAGIAVNKNVVPGDPQPPWITSGIRLGTPALITRGLKPEHMGTVAEFIGDVLHKPDDAKHHAQVQNKVRAFLQQFPLHRNVLASLPVPAFFPG